MVDSCILAGSRSPLREDSSLHRADKSIGSPLRGRGEILHSRKERCLARVARDRLPNSSASRHDTRGLPIATNLLKSRYTIDSFGLDWEARTLAPRTNAAATITTFLRMY